MGRSAAKQGDRIEATDTHMVRQANNAVLSLPFAFSGALSEGLSADVRIMGRPAATLGSGANCSPPQEAALAPGSSFTLPPTNTGSVAAGSVTVRINGQPAARHGDAALTCNEPPLPPVGQVVADGTVSIG